MNELQLIEKSHRLSDSRMRTFRYEPSDRKMNFSSHFWSFGRQKEERNVIKFRKDRYYSPADNKTDLVFCTPAKKSQQLAYTPYKQQIY